MPNIGVAVGLPEPWASQLREFRTALGDPTAESIPSHITLVPPTYLELAELPDLHRQLSAAAKTCAPFRIHLRGTGTFRPISPVVFIALAEGISGCEALANAVRRPPLDTPLKFPFHPHVTVAHHLSEQAMDRAFSELASFECAFDCAEFHLYVHDPASGWEKVHRYRLRAPDHVTLAAPVSL
ncbi:MAG: 2'-5' RNA ligase family protein [Nocardioides sp.]